MEFTLPNFKSSVFTFGGATEMCIFSEQVNLDARRKNHTCLVESTVPINPVWLYH